MPKGKPSVSKEVKEQIVKRIKEDGVPVAQIAEEHGLKPRLIYSPGSQEESLPRLLSWKSPDSSGKTRP